MTSRKNEAKAFAEYWANQGDEKSHSQSFWLSLLRDVLGVAEPEKAIHFEERVKLDHTSFIDGHIPATHVLIEQKRRGLDLKTPIRQSDGSLLTPFQQAQRYSAALSYSQRPRWIVTCNFQEFLIYDMEKPTGEPESILLKDLAKEYYRLQFLVEEKDQLLQREEEVSIQAGQLVGLLYDAILEQYLPPPPSGGSGTDKSPQRHSAHQLHSLNILCVRLVFCLYAEDSGIFGDHLKFHNYIAQFQPKDLRRALMDLFRVLDTIPQERDPYLDEMLASFPYVNGGLFAHEDIEIPNFTQEILDLLLHKASEGFDWSQISPTIFGAVFESTLNPQTRRSGGMHYTSIENIHKVIDPLFLDGLREEFEGIQAMKVTKTRNERAEAFREKLAGLTFLDPACGSGNFLTETYLSLRRLENQALRLVTEGQMLLDTGDVIKVSIAQFYGIEINDFAVTVAKTALWIAESQMMAETEEIMNTNLDFLPLKSYANIVEGNALRMDWGQLGARNENLGDRNEREELRGLDNMAKINGVDSRNLSLGKTPAKGRNICSAKSNETSSCVDSIEYCRRIRAKESERVSPVFVDIEGISHGTRNSIEDLRKDRIFDSNTSFNCEEPLDRDKQDDISFTNSSFLKTISYDYIMGNPPFVGNNNLNAEQRQDLLPYFPNNKTMDYVAAWYVIATRFIVGAKTRCAFVSTNSITQGEQVALLWKPLFEKYGVHIDFAHRTFRWDSEASAKAQVHCVIVGFSVACNNKDKIIYSAERPQIVEHINAYLLDGDDVFIMSRSKPLCNVSEIRKGNQPTDGGNLIIEAEEIENFLQNEPLAKPYIKKLIGAKEYINNLDRYCLWLVGIKPEKIRKMPSVMERVRKVREMRLSSPDKGTQRLADYPTLFRETNNPKTFIVVPSVSSENRKYIPMGFLDENTIPTNLVLIIPDAEIYHFGVLTSNVHMAWVRAVCGRLKSDYRYSKDIVYNNFPWPTPTAEQKKKIEETAQAILDARSLYPDCSLADLYDEVAMPPELRKAHQANDRAVMQAYGFDVKTMTESTCVAELMKMYQKLVADDGKAI